jgi:hypothetical protein
MGLPVKQKVLTGLRRFESYPQHASTTREKESIMGWREEAEKVRKRYHESQQGKKAAEDARKEQEKLLKKAEEERKKRGGKS